LLSNAPFRDGNDDFNFENKVVIHTAEGTPSSGLSLEDFELIEKLGKGSFGSVFLVTKKNDPTKQYYALKVLEKDKVFQQNLLRYAKTERNVLCQAQHQFIVGLKFAFQSPSRLYLIMQYCPGGDMGMALAKDRRFTIEQCQIYTAEIVLALEYLHKRKILFRDLKPDNVVFDEDGHACLTDFGLAKQGIGVNDTSQSFCGSVAYLAPEMLRRTGHARSIDWYLLGVLIYEMLVGVPPYFNTDKAKLFENIQSGPLKIPHTMPPPARNLILSLLNRNP
jgi:serine/threonine protein kinase